MKKTVTKMVLVMVYTVVIDILNIYNTVVLVANIGGTTQIDVFGQ